MELIAFAVAAVALYFVAGGLLDFIERVLGRRFEDRNLVFFAILLVLALVAFWAIRRMFASG